MPGVTVTPGTLAARWLPAGFRLTGGHPSAVSASVAVTYSSARVRQDPPRVALSFSYHKGPLTPAVGGRPNAAHVTVAGHAGLLESGPPAPQFTSVYWSPRRGYLLNMVGYLVPAATVLKVARQVEFTPPGGVPLPLVPGRVVSASAAIAAARAAAHAPSAAAAAAKLTSWTEAAALLEADGHQIGASAVPAAVSAAPWRPVWAVLIGGARASGASVSGATGELIVVDAASGRPAFTMAVAGRAHWFAALTDRDPAVPGCPGGSTARVPFGVLTRDEEAYLASGRPASGTAGATTSVVLKLTSVAVVNRADPGMYGGCLQENCSLRRLVWMTVTTVRAAPGRTVACLPGTASVPPGYQPARVRQYEAVSVPDNSGIYCGALPARISGLTDLAPPAGRAGG